MSDTSSICSDTSFMSDIDYVSSINFDLSNGSPIDINNVNIIHYNINSITVDGRIDQLTDYCKLLGIDILVITESKLDETIPNNLLIIPGYHEPLRRDRPINGRHGGGVLIYIADHLLFEQKTSLQSEHFEHIWADIKFANQTFAVNALYRPPSENIADHDIFLTTIDDILQNLQRYSATHKIITSDMNYGNIYCKMPILDHKPLDSKAPDIFASYGFSQLIDIPTRVTSQCVSLIDLFYVDCNSDVLNHGTLPKNS